jgi:hypothetical protein
VTPSSAIPKRIDIVGPVRASQGQLPAYVSYPGQLAILNFCWLLASLPVVTALAAGAAMQATLQRLSEGESRPAKTFLHELRAQLPRLLWLGAAVPALLAALVLSVSFWLAVTAPVRLVALGVLLSLAALALAGILALLEIAANGRGHGVRALLAGVLPVLASRPLRSAVVPVALLTWTAILLRFPTVGLVAGAVVPGLLARWCFHASAARLMGTAR